MKLNRTLAQWGAILLSASTIVACGDDDDDNGTGPQPTPPAAPQNVEVTFSEIAAPGVYDATVSWDAVADADTYDVTLDDGTTETTESTSATDFTFEDIPAGADVAVEVVASNADGDSDPTTTEIETPLSRSFFEAFDNTLADPGFDPSAFDRGTQTAPPDFTLAAMPAGYTAATLPGFDGNLVAPTDGRTLEATNYAGAIAPGTAYEDAWYNGWTVWAADGSDSRSWDPAGANVIEVTEDILDDERWTSDNIYRLVGPIFVGSDCGPDPAAPLATCDPAVLTIDPGTTITADPDPGNDRGSYLVITRGSQIIADAFDNPGAPAPNPPTEDQVIVFTSENVLTDNAARGDWGGIVVNGRASINSGEEGTGEGDSGLYGGVDDNDSSGILRGVRIEFAGDAATTTDQLNGLALQGTGAGTTVSYLQVHYNFDDGIEPFGGTTSVDHLVVTGIGDDSVDGTDGYRGFMQFVLGQQRGDEADNGMELSNNGDDDAAEPRTTAVIANATMIGGSNAVVDGEIAGALSSNGVQFREGSNYRVYNSIFTGFGAGGICIRDARTIQNALDALFDETADVSSTLAADGLILWNNGAADDADENFGSC